MYVPLFLTIGTLVNLVTFGLCSGLAPGAASIDGNNPALSVSLGSLESRHDPVSNPSIRSLVPKALRVGQITGLRREKNAELQKIADQFRSDTESLAFDLNDVDVEPEEFLYRVAVCGLKSRPTGQVSSVSNLWGVWQDLRHGKISSGRFSAPVRLYLGTFHWYKAGIWNEDLHVFAVAIRDIFRESRDQPADCV